MKSLFCYFALVGIYFHLQLVMIFRNDFQVQTSPNVGIHLLLKEEDNNMKRIMMRQPFSLKRLENLGSLQHKNMKGTFLFNKKRKAIGLMTSE